MGYVGIIYILIIFNSSFLSLLPCSAFCLFFAVFIMSNELRGDNLHFFNFLLEVIVWLSLVGRGLAGVIWIGVFLLAVDVLFLRR